MSRIEWTERTWNPIVGCSVVSPGCTNCYAMKMAARIERMSPGLAHYLGLTQQSKAGPVWTGKVALSESALLEPLRRRRPTTYFVNSMSDLFHESIPDEWIDRVFAVMAEAPQHTFQVLTKRARRMREYVGDMQPWSHRVSAIRKATSPILAFVNDQTRAIRFPLPNVWLGVSAEDQTRADERIPDLLATPASVRFVSAEPLLGPIDFTRIGLSDREKAAVTTGFYVDATVGHAQHGIPRLDWIIVGGESGPNARPMHPAWARSIRDQCVAARVAYFFKQMTKKGPIPDDLLVREFPHAR